MGKVKVDISTSLDGFITGPDDRTGQELGEGGEQLHEWVVGVAGWRKRHGLEGGETGPDDDVHGGSGRGRRGGRDGAPHVRSG